MLQLSAARTITAQAAGVTVLTLGSVLLLAWVAAYWTWAWLAPHPITGAPPIPGEIRRLTSADFLFGTAAEASDRVLSANIGIKLLGVVAPTASGKGYALLHLDPNQTIAVEKGQDIAPGIRLADIGVDHVVLERGLDRETLAWPIRQPGPVVLPALRIGK